METSKDLSQSLMIELLERSRDVVYRYDIKPESGYSYISPAVEKLTGYTPEEHYRNPSLFRQYIHPDDVARLREIVEKKGAGLTTFRIIHKDGSVKWIERNETPVLNKTGHVVAYEGIIRDITAQHTALTALKKSEERLQKAQQVAGMGFLDWDIKTNEIELSPQVIDMYGLDPGHRWITPEFFARMCHPDDLEFVQKNLEEAITGNKPYNIDHRIVRPDGTILWVHAQAEVQKKDEEGRPIQFLVTVVDITKQKMAIQALQDNEERYRAVVENSHEGILIVDENYRYEYVNDTFCMLLGRSRKEIIGHDFREFISEESKHLVAERYKKRQQGETVPSRYEFYILRKDGRKKLVEISSTVVKNSKGKKRTIAQLLDITEQRKAEEEIRLQSAALESAANSIIITDSAGKIEWVNKTFTKINGYTRKEALGENPRILKSGQHPQSFYKEMWNTILAGKTWRGKIVNRKKDGALYTEELSITPIKNYKNEITHFVAIQIDITQQEALLQELHTALERLHHLSHHSNQRIENERKNIARNLHDNLGQVLTAIKMDISWLTRQLPQETKSGVIERIHETKSLVNQAISTVQQITAELRPNILDELGLWNALEYLCEEMSKRSGIAFGIEMPQTDISVPEEFVLPVYRVVQEATTNIIRHSGATKAILQIKQSPNEIFFSVRDNGTGIPQEKTESMRSFGLMGMKERIELLGGEFKIRTEKKGTEVLFNLPLPKHKKS